MLKLNSSSLLDHGRDIVDPLIHPWPAGAAPLLDQQRDLHFRLPCSFLPVGVSYNADLKLAQELMLQAAKDSPRVLKTPKPNVWLAGYGDSSVDHEVLVWINDPEGGVGNVRSDVLTRLWHLFKENDIEIPFPQRDVHVKSWSSEAKPGGETPS